MEATKSVPRRFNMVTVQMSQRRWNRILSLEQTYKLARTIKRSMDQVKTAPALSAGDAIDVLRSLWKYESPMTSRALSSVWKNAICRCNPTSSVYWRHYWRIPSKALRWHMACERYAYLSHPKDEGKVVAPELLFVHGYLTVSCSWFISTTRLIMTMFLIPFCEIY